MAIEPRIVAADLRRASLARVQSLDLRAANRDLWADEAALFDRLQATLAGLDDAAWHLPGAAPSDAGGPDWSMAEHVGHIADWQDLAVDYIGVAAQTGRWPSDEDFDGGDFDRFNERRREPWASMPSADIADRLAAARPRLLAAARMFSEDELRGDPSWGWTYMTLHGHYLDHLTVLEPWAAALRLRQVDGDPFVADARSLDHRAFRHAEMTIAASFDSLVRPVPMTRWDSDQVTPGWTLRDHLGHLADWAVEGIRAIDQFRTTGAWPADPAEGIDAWNERHVVAARAGSTVEAMARYDAARLGLLDAVDGLDIADLRSPDGWSWTYDCLHGHARKHLAMVGPWCVATRWAVEG
jgi:hypothetical protein